MFDKIYADNLWGGSESKSGSSGIRDTEDLRKFLPHLLDRLQIRTILDVPCGDFVWMKTVDLQGRSYIGADIVSEMVAKNTENFGRGNIQFCTIDLRKDPLPSVDLVLCRDCLIHLSFKDCREALRNIMRSGATWFLTTTHPDLVENRPIRTGDYRPLNLEKPPFNFPKPLQLTRDRYEPKDLEDLVDPFKSIGLWRVEDLKSNKLMN